MRRPPSFPQRRLSPPEDPLVGEIDAAGSSRGGVPGLPTVGTAYSYLQDYLPHVARGLSARVGRLRRPGTGRSQLSGASRRHAGRPRLAAEESHRTFSDCTTAPTASPAAAIRWTRSTGSGRRRCGWRKEGIEDMPCEEAICDVCGKMWRTSGGDVPAVRHQPDRWRRYTTRAAHRLQSRLAQFIVISVSGGGCRGIFAKSCSIHSL